MTEQDKIWIEKCKVDWNYTIMVDNDEVFVVQGDEVVHTFSEYGYYFVKHLLQYIGCDADFV
jgi:hypothetical protein